MEKAFDKLKAPARRISVDNTPMPFAVECERYVMPSVEKIVAAVTSMFKEEK